MPLRPRTLRLFSAFSPAGPKGCSKDDERVLKGCLCLCHPSQKLFFRRKHLHGAILFPKFSAKIQQIFEIYKDFSNKMQFYLYFVLQSQINRSFGRFFYFYLHISQKSSTFARKIVERCRGFRIKLIL